jgi:hypothetical protein
VARSASPHPCRALRSSSLRVECVFDERESGLLKVMACGVRQVPQRPLPGEHCQAVHSGPDRVLDFNTASLAEHSRVGQFVEYSAKLVQWHGVLPCTGGRILVGVLLRQGERGREQPRLGARNRTLDVSPDAQMLVTAAEWFAGGQRIWYDPGSARIMTDREAAAIPTALHVFERIATTGHSTDEQTVWLTMLPGFPDGSYGWARVDRILGDGLVPRLYVEPVGQGDSDKPRDYPYSTMERADLIEALWRHHGVRRTVVVTFDYTSLALLELLRRQAERGGSRGTAGTVITAAFMVNGGLFADSHSHPWQGTPLLRTPLGALGTVALYIGGSGEDAYEHRQIPAARQRVPQAEVVTFPGGHLTTNERPDLLAAKIWEVASRHGVGDPGRRPTSADTAAATFARDQTDHP